MASGVAACIARMRSSECGRRELRMTTGDALMMGFIKLPRDSRGIHENGEPPPLWEWSRSLHEV